VIIPENTLPYYPAALGIDGLFGRAIFRGGLAGSEKNFERYFDNLAREVGALRCPIAERRAEAMHGDVAAARAPQDLGHSHVGQWLGSLAART
jgi:hypothetical protein